MTRSHETTRNVPSSNPASLEGDCYLTTDEVAERLRVPKRTVEDWRLNRQGLRFVRFGYRTIRYLSSDVAEFKAAARAAWDDWQAS